MKKAVWTIAGALALPLAYLTLWPVPIAPQAWNAPTDLGYVGKFEANTRLADLERLPIAGAYGPEDVTYRETEDGLRIYTSGHSGEIVEINPVSKTARVIANTGGVPLGIEFGHTDTENADTLYIADSHKGLMAMTPSGELSVLTDSVNGTPIKYADDLDIAPNGVIYFSDASTKFGAQEIGSTMQASLLELMEHGKTGRVLAYDPRDKSTSVIADGLSFSNGVAMAKDGQSILVNETGTYQVHRIYIDGPSKGTREVVLDNLPGFPDNINDLPDGGFLLGLISKRSAVLDKTSAKPFMRKLAMRLPASMRAKSVNYGLIVHLSPEGEVLHTLHDPSGGYPQTTGAILAPDGYLYVSSLSAKEIGRVKLR